MIRVHRNRTAIDCLELNNNFRNGANWRERDIPVEDSLDRVKVLMEIVPIQPHSCPLFLVIVQPISFYYAILYKTTCYGILN